ISRRRTVLHMAYLSMSGANGKSTSASHRSDRGRKDRLISVPPPSEPYRRISRIRLSSQWYSPQRGLTRRPMGCFQAIQSQASKVRIRPALMIRAAAPPPLFLPFPEYASQPTPNPTIQLGERRFIAVFEVFKPASQRRIQRPDDRRKALPVGSLRLRSDRVLELL